MALKALMLRKKIDLRKKDLAEKRAALDDIQKREAELVISVEEVTNEEEAAVVQESIDTLTQEKEKLEESAAEIEGVIADLEAELASLEESQDTTPPDDEARDKKPANEERSKNPMNKSESTAILTRDRVFRGMSRAEQDDLVQRDSVKAFLGAVRDVLRSRSSGGQARAITNIGLTLPQEFLGILRQNVLDYSKLTRHVTVQNVNGEGRVLISGDIPEAVWTECCANLNELALGFNQEAFGCWKLGGFFVICNANLEDSDLDMAAEIITTLAQSLAYTDDKTVLYGNGTNMPMGIVTRLAQESQPAGYPATARTWADLHTTNIKTIANTYTGQALFQQLVLAAGSAKGKYARGEKVWVMNEFTYSFLMAQAMNVDAAGAIVSQVNGTMPVIGGIIEVLPDSIVPNYNIIMGYYELYRRVNRAGAKYASSDEYFFLSDQTVFKATERWDGKPLIAEAFVLIGINGTSPATSATFAGDGANTPQALLLPATAKVTVSGELNMRSLLTILPYGVDTTLSWVSATVAKATVNSATGVVSGVSTGSSVITVTAANGLTAQCTVTVEAGT